jgi:hypothetical protein
LFDYRTVGLPSFLDKHIGRDAHAPEYSWEDVLKGIEEISHNVTTALLTLSLGTLVFYAKLNRPIRRHGRSELATRKKKASDVTQGLYNRKNWHERVKISQEWRANLPDRLCGTPSYHSSANSRGWLKDSIALGNHEQFTAEGQ